MPLDVPFHSQPPASAPSAIVRTLTRQDMMWDRPIFKAPPLVIEPPVADLKELAIAVRRPDALLG